MTFIAQNEVIVRQDYKCLMIQIHSQQTLTPYLYHVIYPKAFITLSPQVNTPLGTKEDTGRGCISYCCWNKQFSWENLSTGLNSVEDAGKINILCWVAEGEHVQGRTEAGLAIGRVHSVLRGPSQLRREKRGKTVFLLCFNSFKGKTLKINSLQQSDTKYFLM